MLAYLEQGSILYALAVFCLIGVIGKLTVNHVYKSLIKQSDNLATATDKQLQQMKTKYESIYRINCGVKDCGAFVAKRMQQYRVLGIRLSGWSNCDLYLGAIGGLLCLLSAFWVYWMDGSVKMIAAYACASGMAFGAMLLFHYMTGGSANRSTLETSLCHYFENVLIVRGPRLAPQETKQEESARAKTSMRDDIFMKKPAREEDPDDTYENEEKPAQRTGNGQRAEMEALKESLSQIAAARGEGNEKRSRKLTQKEEQLIDEILRQYLS